MPTHSDDVNAKLMNLTKRKSAFLLSDLEIV